MTRLHFVIKGRVQGIGYRWFVQENAERLGLSGWVANRFDGTVEAEAEGSPQGLEDFARLLESGHPFARVDAVESKPVAARGGGKPFEIR